MPEFTLKDKLYLKFTEILEKFSSKDEHSECYTQSYKCYEFNTHKNHTALNDETRYKLEPKDNILEIEEYDCSRTK